MTHEPLPEAPKEPSLEARDLGRQNPHPIGRRDPPVIGPVGAVAAILSIMFCGGFFLIGDLSHRGVPHYEAQGMNSARQLMLAMQNYHDRYQSLPPAYISDANGKPAVSWRTLILPYIEESLLFDQYDQNQMWDSPMPKGAYL